MYEIDPLVCPHCGEQMRIVAMIDKRDQAHIIEKILKHCGLWREPASIAPPACPHHPVSPGCRREFNLEGEYIPIDEFLANF